MAVGQRLPGRVVLEARRLPRRNRGCSWWRRGLARRFATERHHGPFLLAGAEDARTALLGMWGRGCAMIQVPANATGVVVPGPTRKGPRGPPRHPDHAAFKAIDALRLSNGFGARSPGASSRCGLSAISRNPTCGSLDERSTPSPLHAQRVNPCGLEQLARPFLPEMTA